jgi:hypothetical protein
MVFPWYGGKEAGLVAPPTDETGEKSGRQPQRHIAMRALL